MSAKAIEVATSAEGAEKSAQQLRGAEQLHMGQVLSPNVSPLACSRSGGEGHWDVTAATKSQCARDCCLKKSVCQL